VEMGLEEELEALMAGAEVTVSGAEKAQKKAVKTRRKSKDLEEMMSSMSSGAKTEVKRLVKEGESATELFKKIDKDGSGKIDHKEFRDALKDKNVEKTDEEVFDMMKNILKELECDVPESKDDEKCKIDEKQFIKLIESL